MTSLGGGRRAALLEPVSRPPADRMPQSATRRPARLEHCAGCAAEIEGGAVLRNGLLYCGFECAAYAAGRVPGLYLG